jgi:hypothetical protein
LQQAFEEARRTFFTQRARLRELDGKLAGLAEVERKLADAEKKLSALSQADHAAVLRAFAQAQHQAREMKSLLEQLRDGAARIADLPNQIVLDDWSSQHFTDLDADLLAWRHDIDLQVEQVRIGGLGAVVAIRQRAQTEAADLVKASEAAASDAIARRTAAATSRIAAAERTATAELKAEVAAQVTKAAAAIIAARADKDLQTRLTDEAIAGLDRRLH